MTSETKPHATRSITTPDGVRIAVADYGAPDGRPVLFIHGYAQAGLCWMRQVEDPALAHLRLVTYDLRGHGASDKPLDPLFYQDGRRWADEVAAVISQCELEAPLLVGWSYGGRIIGDYLAAYGDARISGLVFVDAITAGARHFYGSCNRLMREMADPDLSTCIRATRAFLRAFFPHPLDPDTFEILLAAAMTTPAAVRAAMARPAAYDETLGGITRPTLVIHGAEDQVIALAMAIHIAALVPDARFDVFEGSGHAPFLDSPGRFNAALRAFAER